MDDGRLVLRRKRGPAIPLRPAFTDAFDSPGGLIRFQREGQKVTGLMIGAGRARDLRFTRTAG